MAADEGMPLSREGKERSFRENLVLAHTLPGVAGMVNAIGYLQLGFYTSHVTGRASGLGVNVAKGKLTDALHMGALLAGFLFGAMLASALIELAKSRRWPRFQLPLLIEALLLSVILLFETLTPVPIAELPSGDKIAYAVAIAMSMGLQNALIARLSGAVVRTTHLTGVTTDLGVELVRVIRWYLDSSRNKSPSERLRQLAELARDTQLYRVRIYLTVLFTFIGGALLGAFLSIQVGVLAMVPPILVVVGLVLYDRLLAVSDEDLEEHYNPMLEAKQSDLDKPA